MKERSKKKERLSRLVVSTSANTRGEMSPPVDTSKQERDSLLAMIYIAGKKG